jgi:hypothetical protein
MCKGETENGGGAVRRSSFFRPASYLECAETWREAAQHIVSPQNPFHLPEIMMETDWEEVTMLQEEDQEEEDQDQEVTTVGSRRRDARPPAAADPLFLFAATTPHASWFDVRVVYVRVSACCCSEDVAPEALSLRFPPRNIGTALELNGGRISPSEEAVLVLRRDRVDPESAEATYLSTDYVRTSGPLSFQVFFKDEALVGGTLEQQQQSPDEANSPVEEQGDDSGGCKSTALVKSIGGGRRPWSLDCTCVVGQAGCVFSKTRLDDYSSFLSSSLLPAMEVCLVGRHLGTPVILSQTVHLTAARRRSNRQTNTLDVIPEAEELGKLGSLMMIDELALVSLAVVCVCVCCFCGEKEVGKREVLKFLPRYIVFLQFTTLRKLLHKTCMWNNMFEREFCCCCLLHLAENQFSMIPSCVVLCERSRHERE